MVWAVFHRPLLADAGTRREDDGQGAVAPSDRIPVEINLCPRGDGVVGYPLQGLFDAHPKLESGEIGA